MSRVPLLVVVAAVAIACGAVTVMGLSRPGPHREHASIVGETHRTPRLVAPDRVSAAAVLHAWDAARARVWGRGDPDGLAPLYTPGSVAGRHDAAMLRAWAARGLRVTGLRTQLLAVRQLYRGDSEWTLRVTDRIAGGTATGHGLRRALPADSATTRTVELRLLDGHWRVAAVW